MESNTTYIYLFPYPLVPGFLTRYVIAGLRNSTLSLLTVETLILSIQPHCVLRRAATDRAAHIHDDADASETTEDGHCRQSICR